MLTNGGEFSSHDVWTYIDMFPCCATDDSTEENPNWIDTMARIRSKRKRKFIV